MNAPLATNNNTRGGGSTHLVEGGGGGNSSTNGITTNRRRVQWKLRRQGSFEQPPTCEKPYIYALALLKRLDKPIVRYCAFGAGARESGERVPHPPDQNTECRDRGDGRFYSTTSKRRGSTIHFHLK